MTLMALTLIAAMIAGGMLYSGRAGWLEAVSFVTVAVCVWLAVRENVWNFPIGLLNVMTFSIVFFHAKLYADAGLQVVYFVLGCIGWWMWLYGGKSRTALRVGRASGVELIALILFIAASTTGLWQLLKSSGGSVPFWDALTTSISLAAQWLLNRKRLESWIFWIIVDLLYVPLYLYKELYLTAGLYCVFLFMAIIGFRQWRVTWLRQREVDVAMSPSSPREAA